MSFPRSSPKLPSDHLASAQGSTLHKAESGTKNEEVSASNRSQASTKMTPQPSKSDIPGNTVKILNTSPALTRQPHISSYDVPEDAGDRVNASMKLLSSYDLTDATDPPEIIGLFDDGPYTELSFSEKRQIVDREPDKPLPSTKLYPIPGEPQADRMELDSTPQEIKDEFPLPVLEDNDITWQVDAEERAKKTEDVVAEIQAGERKFRNGLRMNTLNNAANTSTTTNEKTGPAAIDSDEEHATAIKNFEEAEKYYSHRKTTGDFNYIDDIDYDRLRRLEVERIRRRQKQNAYNPAPEADNESMFFPEAVRSATSPNGEVVDEWPSAYLEGEDVNPIPEMGTPTERSTRREATSKGSTSTSRARVAKGKVSKPRKTTKKAQKPNTFAGMDSLFKNSNNLISIAQANQHKSKQPTFTSTTKATALKQLISSMPEEQRKIHNLDRKELELASKKFFGHGVVKSDGDGGWKLKGMKSSLRNHQLLGAAFMRDRESGSPPYGGFVADEMGFGKTLLALSCVIDGQAANPNSKARTTLVVAPSALLTQWLSEIEKHAESSRLKHVLLYRSKASLQTRDQVAELSRQDVVITSYHEIMRSWPKNDPPLHLCSPESKAAWFADQCKNHIGVLHRVTWDRVILDEAHAIKNYLSRTSEAVCQLKAKYRWAISGTPIQNKLEEFYAFFRFIQIPHTGSFDSFRLNFCKKGSHLAIRRLQSLLGRYMLRRTHEDQLLGAPILTLPNIRSTTVTVKFSHIEKAIYSIIRERFVSDIKAFLRDGSIEKKYQTIFVLMLRLRQITAHALLVQKTLKELLEEVDLQRLWMLTENEISPEDQNLARGLKYALIKTVSDAPQTSREEKSVGPIRSRFRAYLERLRTDGKWKEITDKTLCASCKSPPVEPYISGCHHNYCYNCLEDLRWIASQDGNKNDPCCLECGAKVNFHSIERCSREDHASFGQGSPGSGRPRVAKGVSSPIETDTDWFTIGGPIMQSAKTKAAVSQIEQWLQEDESKKQARSKIILFTQVSAWPLS